jgi:hypothetical protein
MADPQQSVWQEIMQGLSKGLIWIAYISIGVLAKLAFDSRNQVLTKKEIVVKSILSIFCGYLAAVICEHTNHSNFAKIIVPVSTLLGEGLILYFMTNWKTFANKFLPGWFQMPNTKKK